MALAIPFNMIGFVVSGDVGDYTIYQDHQRRTIGFPKAPPKMPHSNLQLIQRNRMRSAVVNWKAADPATKLAYEAISMKASLMMTGHNLWVALSMNGDAHALSTLVQQTGIQCPMPPSV